MKLRQLDSRIVPANMGNAIGGNAAEQDNILWTNHSRTQ